MNGVWCREFLREMIFEAYRAVFPDKQLADGWFCLHAVTDCRSLYDLLVGSGLPENRRAAIEVLAIKEMLSEGYDEDAEDILEADGKLPDAPVSDFAHWCSTKEQKADILTKHSTSRDREAWRLNYNFVKVTPFEDIPKHGPRNKKVPIPKTITTLPDQLVLKAECRRGKSLPARL